MELAQETKLAQEFKEKLERVGLKVIEEDQADFRLIIKVEQAPVAAGADEDN
ncbi:hypothetical protein MWH28_12170 [Natroniella sulfidigena]|uniref:hypothetical protein n=1 Tax=Natroniella sulfidigena TaxID=723921 RepID=UPI002009E659|nr:hypothetical protein [Natroniella sulfidigena]MCK8818112.1 hypothetical protein [Natroniella sulfidigena]